MPGNGWSFSDGAMTRRGCLARLSAVFACGGAVAASAGARGADAADVLRSATAAPRLQGTFIQLQASHRSWQRSDWERLFRYFDQLQLQRLIIQWSAFDGVDFGRPASSGAGSSQAVGQAWTGAEHATSVVTTILELAAAHNLQVLVGLDAQSRYWQALGSGPATAGAFLREAESRSLSLARDMVAGLRASPAFAGWYLSEEFDDETWAGEEMRRVLLAHLKVMRLQLQSLTPTLPVAVSGFTNGRNAPAVVGAFWESVLAGSDIDLLLMQDGIGTHKLNLEQLPAYLAAVATATDGRHATCWVVTELFQQVGGPPVDAGSFRAKSASLERVLLQMRTAAPYAAALIGFSVPEYMSPLGDPQAAKLMNDYRQQVLNVR